MSHQLLLFSQVKIGGLFFRNVPDGSENPSIKINDNQARKPNGDIIEVNSGVLVFTHGTPQTDEVFAVGIASDILVGV
jgi:hypothetical protein